MNKFIPFKRINISLFTVCLLLFSCNKHDSNPNPNPNSIPIPIPQKPITENSKTDEVKESLSKDIYATKFEFKPLGSGERIILNVKTSDIESTFNIYSKRNNIKKDIFTFPGFFFGNRKDKIKYWYGEDGLEKNIVFAYSSKEGRSPVLCFVDGLSGIIKTKTISMLPYLYTISDDCNFVCVDQTKGVNVPTIVIYDFSNMKFIKKVIYEPYRDTGMYPIEITYGNKAFTVVISADTVDFTTIEIPIDDTDDYHIVDSYSWEENN